MKTRLLITLLITLTCAKQTALAVASYTGGTYSENFDGEHSSNWVQDSTLPGWFAYQTRYGQEWGPESTPSRAWESCDDFRKSIGQNQQGLLNLGTSSTNTNRSFGSNNEAGLDLAFALVLRNDTLATFTNFTLSYFGEQWQLNSTDFTPTQKLEFSFGVFSSFSAGNFGNNPNTVIPNSQFDHYSVFYNGYTKPAGGALDVSAFRFFYASGPLDGTAPQNRQFKSSTQPFVWAPGEYLILRWFDDQWQPNAILAVNDLHFEAHAPLDTDEDGILDQYETGTGIYVSPEDTGTSPSNPDTDGDGLRDGEEVNTYHTNPNLKDTDGDGWEDGFEVSTGFIPTSAASSPDSLSSIRTAVEYRFHAANGISYRIEASTDLATWTTIETAIIGTGGVITRFYSVEGQPQRFFRSRRN